MTDQSFIVVSDNLTGLLISRALEERGCQVSLVSTEKGFEKAANDDPSTHVATSDSPSPFDLIPFEENYTESFAWIKNLLSLNLATDIATEEVDLSPLVFSDKELKPFLGFGDSKHESLEAISQLNRARYLQPNRGFQGIETAALEGLKAKRMNFTEISGFEVDGDFIRYIKTADGKELSADHYIFCNSPSELLKTFPTDAWTPRTRQRLTKSKHWACIEVDYDHSELSSEELQKLPLELLFFSSQKEELQPFVGRRRGTSSSWRLFVNQDHFEDPEHISNQIKHMKKSLLKAFPEIENSKPALTLRPYIHGSYSWAEGPQGLEGGIKNFNLASPLLNDWPGLASCAAASRSTLSRLF